MRKYPLSRRFHGSPLDQMIKNLEDFESGFDDFFLKPWGGEKEGFSLSPRLDMRETEKEYLINVELPGMDSEDIELDLSDSNVLTLKGEKKDIVEKKEGQCYYSERSYGSFQRRIELPGKVDPDSVDANFEGGILHIKLTKAEPQTSKKIEIKKNKK